MKCDCDYVLTNKQGLQPHYDNCVSVWEKKHPGKKLPKNEDGSIRLPNDHLLNLDVDVLYHLGMDTHKYDLPAMFGDVKALTVKTQTLQDMEYTVIPNKFVCMGGTKYRMKEFAEYITEVLGVEKNGDTLVNLTKHSQRYAMYKVGPVLSVSHGIGIPSMTTLLQEIIKLLYYAKVKNPIMFRIGTSGGLNIQPGSVAVSSWGLNGNLEKTYNVPVLGKTRKLPSLLDTRLSQEIYSLALETDGFATYLGGTMGADDFYRGQARLDGPFCDYTELDKLSFLLKLSDMGVNNIEMEATAFAALTSEAGIRAGIVCVTFLNRLNGDQVTATKSTLQEWQKRPMIIVGRYIANYFKNNNVKS